MPNNSSLKTAALQWADAGFPVFPVGRDKKPLTPHGFEDATMDRATISAWWGLYPEANIGTSPGQYGMAVLDEDPPLGADTLRGLEARYGSLPRTYKVRTPRGGHHYWFNGTTKSTVGTERNGLGPKLDTRSIGGYVLLPPSATDKGVYEVIDETDYADLPAWVDETLHSKEQHHVSATDELDLVANIDRARYMVERAIDTGDVAIEGSGGDARTLQMAYDIRDFGLSEQVALELIQPWNDASQPPWTMEGLEQKIHNAYEYAQNEIGAYAVEKTEDAFKDYIATLPKVKDAKPPFYAYSEEEQDDWPEPSWLVPDVLPDEATVMIYGPSRSFKSFLALDLALGLAYGVETFGARRDPVPTLYIAGESPRGLSRSRRPAWRIARGVEGTGDFRIIKKMPSLLNGGIAALREQMRAQKMRPRLIVIDTLAKAMAGLNENDAKDAGMFIEGIETLRDEFGSTILVIHHTGKDIERGARGSSAFFNGFDATLESHRPDRSLAVSLEVTKMKDADEREEPFAFEGKDMGPGLAFFPISFDAFERKTAKPDPLSGHNVGEALTKLRAIGIENAVTSMTLASELSPHQDNESDEMRLIAIGVVSRKLGKLAKTKLAAYCTGTGHDLRWYIPTQK